MLSIQKALSIALYKWGNREFIYTRDGDTFVPKTFGETVHDVQALGASLLDFGLRDAHILIYGENSYEWCITDLAVMGYVGVTVAASADWREREICNVVNIADVTCVIYSNTRREVIECLRKSKPNIKYISMQDDLPSLLDGGRRLLGQGIAPEFKSRNINDMCKIVFTSGTTSTSKAVMLAERSMFFGCECLYKRAPMDEQDTIFLFLPLSHTYGGIYNLLVSLYFGMRLYICSDRTRVFEELQKVNPTVFCAVPLIYERAYAMLGEGIKNAFGNRIKYLFCGGAKYNTEIRKFYKDLGINILEAYALTETASSFSIEYSGSKGIDSVGTIFENIEVKFIDIDENSHGEILVRGDNLALGYYKNERETAKAFDTDGFFHTGDIGYRDEDGRLYLVRRKKRLIKLSNARNIYPDEIEELLTQFDMVAAAFVYEEDGQIIAKLASTQSQVAIDEIIASLNQTLPDYKRISKAILTDKLLSKLV